MNNQTGQRTGQAGKGNICCRCFKSTKVPLTARTLVLHNCDSQLVWTPCALRISRERKDESLERRVATLSRKARPWCLQYRCGRTCMSACAGVRWAPQSGGAQRILHASHSDKTFESVHLFHCEGWTYPPPPLPSLLDNLLLLLLYFRVTTGYGNIWSVHSSHSLGAAEGRGEREEDPSLPPFLLSLPHLSTDVCKGWWREDTHTHTQTQDNVFVYTHRPSRDTGVLSQRSLLCPHTPQTREQFQ